MGGDVRILIADDHPLMLAAVRSTLEAGGFEVVAEARSGTEVLAQVGRTQPDVVLLDLSMPGMDGLSCLEQITREHSAVRVVVLSASNSPEQIESAFRRGASGFVVKTIDTHDLLAAIRQSIHGTAYHASGLPALDADSAAKEAGLTQQELRILGAVATGVSNKAIADDLRVSEQAIKFHLTNVYRKLHLANRTEAARWAFQHGLVPSKDNPDDQS